MKLPEHLFVSSDGALYDTHMPDWSRHPLRADYKGTHGTIETTIQLRATLRAGPYARPGGYPLYFVTSDGEALSFDTVRAEYSQVSRAVRDKSKCGWRVVGCTINYEDAELTCAHSGNRIESAYGEVTRA